MNRKFAIIELLADLIAQFAIIELRNFDNEICLLGRVLGLVGWTLRTFRFVSGICSMVFESFLESRRAVLKPSWDRLGGFFQSAVGFGSILRGCRGALVWFCFVWLPFLRFWKGAAAPTKSGSGPGLVRVWFVNPGLVTDAGPAQVPGPTPTPYI